jgi:methylmalonyl-CoA/ethylmalonyl-CoA epimerase
MPFAAYARTEKLGRTMNIESASGQRFGLGAIDQISFAVASVDDAVPRYTAMFGGPFAVVDVPGMEVVCRGRPSTASLRLAFGRSGDIEVELVEVVSGPWPTLDWLETHGEGLHHLRYPVNDCDASRAAMEEAGFAVSLQGGAGGVSFAYLESPLLNGLTVELIQMPQD